MNLALSAADAASTSLSGHDVQLIVAALAGIATVVLLITWLKVQPFLSLLLGSAVLAAVAGLAADKAIASFSKGVGDTFGSVGILVALGAMVGRLLVDSGGAEEVVETTVEKVSRRALPWAMAGAAALIGLPMFFEIGLVLLIPIVLMVSRRSDLPVLKVGIPALAGLSVLHGLVPPHPGPLVAIAALKADLGLVLAFGLVIAIPTVIIAGPIFGNFIAPYGPHQPPPGSGAGLAAAEAQHERAVAGGPGTTTATALRRRPSFAATVSVVLLPVVLMLGRAIGELVLKPGNGLRSVLDVIGTPTIALLAGVLLAMFVLGAGTGMDRYRLSDSLEASLPPMAGTLLIIAAGGGFKQTLVDAGVGTLIGRLATGVHLSALVLGWLVAVGIRLATGSATVATITASGIVAPLAANLDKPALALLVLAIGSGSLFFSHVNDVGFWLVKQYFGLTVGQTIKSWSVMETIISVCGLIGALLLNIVV